MKNITLIDTRRIEDALLLGYEAPADFQNDTIGLGLVEERHDSESFFTLTGAEGEVLMTGREARHVAGAILSQLAVRPEGLGNLITDLRQLLAKAERVAAA